MSSWQTYCSVSDPLNSVKTRLLSKIDAGSSPHMAPSNPISTNAYAERGIPGLLILRVLLISPACSRQEMLFSKSAAHAPLRTWPKTNRLFSLAKCLGRIPGRAWFVREALGEWEMATIFKSNAKPSCLIPFDKAMSAKDKSGWVHGFIHDGGFVRLFRNPWRYLPILAQFDGVIAPDCSVFWSYPLYRQLQSICQSREIGGWLQRNGIPVIPCVRWDKDNTYGFAFDGIEPGGTIAVGTVGAMRDKEARKVFEDGFAPMLEAARPTRIVVYGSRRSSVFDSAENDGIEIAAFESATAAVFSKRSA